MPTVHLTPMECAIMAFGSMAEVARVTHVERSTVLYWNKPREDGGCCGQIPKTEHIRVMVQAARERGLKLTAADLVLGRDTQASK